MRLLYQKDGYFGFKEFADASEVKYAILSHRWYPEGDILFADIPNQHQKDVAAKRGWRKLQYSTKQAKDDG